MGWVSFREKFRDNSICIYAQINSCFPGVMLKYAGEAGEAGDACSAALGEATGQWKERTIDGS